MLTVKAETMGSSDGPLTALSPVVLAIAAIQLLLHVVTNGNYGIFRDELYYLDCARNLDWGYVDQPGLSIWLLAAVKAIFGESVHAVRLLSQLAGAATVIVTALIAREMGGGRTAQILAALTTAGAPGAVVLTGFYSMNAFDLLFWALLVWVLVRIVVRDNPSLWLWFGLIAGVGLLNKISVLFLGLGVAVSLLLTPLRRHLGRWQLWAGAAIALLLFAPYLVWNASLDWPTLEFMENARTRKIADISPIEFILEQVLANSPPLAPVWLGGLVWLLVPKWGGRYRAVGFVFLTVLTLLLYLKAKPYYLFAAFSMLYAAGGCAIEALVAAPRRPNARKWATGFVLFWVISSGLFTLPLAIPILSPERFLAFQAATGLGPKHYENNRVGAMPQYFSDRFGWENMAQVVAEVYEALPEEERQRAAIVAGNYGEAGAINLYGPALGLPRAYSTHNNHFFWGPPSEEPLVLIRIGGSAERSLELFEHVEEVARVHSTYGMPYESDLPILLLRSPRRPLVELWAEGKNFI